MRSRNIKPGFFHNDLLAELPPLTRILFAGLWLVADRCGRLEDRPKRIKGQVLPYDDGDVDVMLESLASAGFVRRYVVEGQRFIQVANFERHQNPHKRESESTIPAEVSASMSTAQCKHQTSTVLVPVKALPSPADSLIPDSLIPDSQSGSVETPPDVPRAVGPQPAAAPGGAEEPQTRTASGSLPGWLAQDLGELGVSTGDQAALHRRLGTLPLRAAVVQIQRKGTIRRPGALLNTKAAELAAEGAEFLRLAADAAEAGAPGMRQDRGWQALPAPLREDPEVRAAWAVLHAAEAAHSRARGGGGELEALDTVTGARRQLNALLAERGGKQAPARAAPGNVHRLAAPG